MLSATEKEYVAALMEKCLQGDALALESMASFYYEDHPEEMNDRTASLVREYYEKAADMGRQKACLNLGTLYFDGRYTEQDLAKAVQLFRAARSGEDARLAAIANAKLGDCYRLGLGVETSYGKAFDCYLEGVLLCNHPVCLYKLGDMYRAGLFVEQDVEKAFFIYNKAKTASQRFANDSYDSILLRLAEATLEGVGTEKDVPTARKYLAMAKRMPCQSSCPEDIRAKIDSLTEKASKA